jgi:hypothetical protein
MWDILVAVYDRWNILRMRMRRWFAGQNVIIFGGLYKIQ